MRLLLSELSLCDFLFTEQEVQCGFVISNLFFDLGLLVLREGVALDVESAHVLLNTSVELLNELASLQLPLPTLLHQELLLTEFFLLG